MTIAWWIWMLAGLALLGLEALTPGGFVMIFFGGAALLVGAMAGMGVAGATWAQVLLFSLLSVASLLLFRRRLLAMVKAMERHERPPIDSLVGEVATLSEDLAPGAVGKAELRGAVWKVQSETVEALARGRRCRVERVEGLTLWVRPE